MNQVVVEALIRKISALALAHQEFASELEQLMIESPAHGAFTKQSLEELKGLEVSK